MSEIWFPNLGIEIEHLRKVAFTIAGKEIFMYGICMGLAVLAGVFLATILAKRTGQDPEEYIDFALYAVVVSILCARAYYVLFSWDFYSANPSKILAFRSGGLAIYGAVIGGVLTAIVYSKVKKKNFWLLGDTAVPCLILGQMLGRWGNFFNREAFGGYTEGLFAMRLQLSQVRTSDLSQEIVDHIINVGGVDYIQVHPTFLYESLWCFAVLILLLYVTKHKKFHGQVTGLYFLGYGLGRVWIEGLRTDQLMLGSFAVSQMLSAILIVAAIVLLVVLGRKAKASVAEAGVSMAVVPNEAVSDEEMKNEIAEEKIEEAEEEPKTDK